MASVSLVRWMCPRSGPLDGGILSPWADHRASVAAPDASKVEAFCSAPDAPAWIVAPMMLDPEFAARLGSLK